MVLAALPNVGAMANLFATLLRALVVVPRVILALAAGKVGCCVHIY